MTPAQILEAAITKAIDGGWTVDDWTDDDEFHWSMDTSEYGVYPLMHVDGNSLNEEFWLRPNDIIFNHNFAQAIWGSILHKADPDDEDKYPYRKLIPAWQYHLMQMVIAPDPIAYLGEHLG